MKKLLLILSLLLLTGCSSNYRELNELGIITAFGIKKVENEYELDLQLVNIMESGKNGVEESPITIVSGKGKTIFDAARSLNLKSSKIFFLADVKYVILDKSILTEDLNEIMDFLSRDTRLSMNFIVVTCTENDPIDILSSLSEFEINPATNLYNIVSLSELRYGLSYSLTIKKFLSDYLENGKDILIPNIVLNGSTKDSQNIDNLENSNTPSYIELKDLVFINDKKEIIHLTDDEMFGYNFINNNIKNATITTECEGGYYTVETLTSKTKLKNKLKEDKIIISSDIEAELVYYGCNEQFDNKKTLNKISNKVEDTIENYYKKVINKSKENNIDFIGLGNYIYKSNPKYFNFDKNNWNKEGLNKLNFDYKVEVNIYKQGNLKEEV